MIIDSLTNSVHILAATVTYSWRPLPVFETFYVHSMQVWPDVRLDIRVPHFPELTTSKGFQIVVAGLHPSQLIGGTGDLNPSQQDTRSSSELQVSNWGHCLKWALAQALLTIS